MRSDDARTILIVADHPHLSAAVRERIARETALIRWVTPQRLADAWPRCRPWPWVVIGAGQVPDELPPLVGTRPVVLAWLRGSTSGPGSLPDGCRRLQGWPDLAAWLPRLARVRVGPMRLAPYRGVQLSSRNTLVRAPAVEALLAAHPRGVSPSPSVRDVRGLLARHAVPCTIRQHGNLLRLEPVEGELR